MAEFKGGLVVDARPMISVTMNEHQEVTITVTGMDDEFEHVKIEDVCFPADCLDAVIEALQDLKR